MKDITLNFGSIQETISRLIASSILNENKNYTLNSFADIVQKSPILLKQHLVFENFKNCKPFTKERLAERFINQNLNILKEHNWKEITNANRDLRITMLENTHVEATEGQNTELFNNVQNLIESTTTPGYLNINKTETSFDYLLEHLTRSVKKDSQSIETQDSPEFNWKFITEMAVNNFDKRFSHLNETDKKTFSMLISEDLTKKGNFINDLKDENIEMIVALLEGELKENNIEGITLLESFKEKMNSGNMKEISQNDLIIAYNELNEQLKNF